HPLQVVDIIDQHPMLLIKFLRTGREALIPKDHDKIYCCLLSRKLVTTIIAGSIRHYPSAKFV
ncbi:MAG TPA: hypothetical protein VKA67_00405, partial [Verrucomicrobiae bacterium]|nr:hypothetical protein [Verrucomicrobiae bacterium]